jgi:hypothetical protein
MRITSGGDLVVGGTASAYANTNRSVITADGVATALFGLQVGGVAKGYFYTTGTDIYLVNETTTGSLFLSTNGTARLSISSGGGVSMPTVYSTYSTGNAANLYMGAGGTLYVSTSSIKYKKDIRNYDKGLAEVLKMRPVYYKGISEYDEDTQFAGLIAEEIEELGLTEFVQYEEDGSPRSLAYASMVTLLTKAIQELSAKNDALGTRLQLLENK